MFSCLFLGFSTFPLIVFFWEPFDFLKLFVALALLALLVLAGSRFSNNRLINYINKSENPRNTFWKLFRENELLKKNLSVIPQLNHKIDSFIENYVFFDKYDKRKLRFYINKYFVRFQDNFGKFVTYKFEEIEDVTLSANIYSGRLGNVAFLSIEIILKNKSIDYCNIINIDCDIDILEQIIEYFKTHQYID